MFLLFGLAAAFEFVFGRSLLSGLQPAAWPLHESCVALWTQEPAASLGRALVCGREVSDPSLKMLFLRTGLYHVLVVSGAHLILLLSGMELICRRRPWIHGVALFAFAAMTGFGAPVVRAGAQLLLAVGPPSGGRDHAGIGPPPARILHSYLIALALHPPWWNSLSLHLSVVAATALASARSGLGRGLLVGLFTWPLILPLGQWTLFGAVGGILLSPLIGALLFPVFLVAWPFAGLQKLLSSLIQPGLALAPQILARAGEPLRGPALIPEPCLPLYALVVLALAAKTSGPENCGRNSRGRRDAEVASPLLRGLVGAPTYGEKEL